VTSLDSFGELVVIVYFFEYNVLFFLVLKAYLNLGLLGLGKMAVKL
jgi:hypothetical protein